VNVVIVESPAKAKTINKYLGSDYEVYASYGHVRDLPSKNGSVDPDDDFSMLWDVDTQSKKRLNDIAKAVKGSDKLILATDPDREGEAISWHVLEILEQKKALKDVTVERVVFNAITKKSILEAIQNPRAIDTSLVDAYLARRALDYLVGFTLSPVLWRKLPGSRSAGRVQSVALRLVCERELEIESFNPREYWSITADMATGKGDAFTARLQAIGGKKLGKFDIADEASAKKIEVALNEGRYVVEHIESKPQKRHPSPPFTTSTLQQEASRKLGFTSRQTMQVAQKLYEGISIGGETQGLITYMRTDGVQIAGEAIASCRNVISNEYGEPYVPGVPRAYKTKAKNAQEAHEAIRPTELSRLPKMIAKNLDPDQLKLYDLIWKRTIASQMESAEMERTSVDIATTGKDDIAYNLRATGSVVRFDGFLKLYQEDIDDDKKSDDEKRLPALSKEEVVGMQKLSANQHFTEPPPRFSEASLIKRMEELGIGRPSTYTSILTVLRDRGYAVLEKKRFHPEDKGRLVTAFLESFFARYVEYDFTASLEGQLDQISDGKLEWKQVLREFWNDFTTSVEDISDLRITQVLDSLNEVLGPHVFPTPEDGSDPRKCPDEASSLPDGKILGKDPETDLDVSLRTGRFGPYVQLGEPEGKEKPKRASLPKNLSPLGVDLEKALQLLSLPREVGAHPESGNMITAGLGRYGPYVLHDGLYASLESPEEVFTVGLNRAVSLLAEKAAKGGGRRGGGTGKSLGDHPDGGKIEVKDGRYGAYVKHGRINATIPKDIDKDDVTLEMAIGLINEKAAKGTKKKAPAKKKAAAKKKAPAKKATKKKTAKKD